MQCNRCGAQFPTGTPTCPYCAQPISPQAGSSSPHQGSFYAEPTVAATPPPPPTLYATPPPPPPPVSSSQPFYPAPPQAGAYAPQPIMVPVMVQAPPKSGCATAAWIVLLVLVLVSLCGGTIFAATTYQANQNTQATATSNADDASTNATATSFAVALTPTPYPPYTESDSPSGANFSEAAQQVISSAQLASAVDNKNRPTELQSTFQSGQTIYLVYSWTRGYTGYVQTRWYVDGKDELNYTSDYTNQYATGYGYMSDSFISYGNVEQGTIEVFWCQDKACTRGGLAWARPFTITAN